MSKALLFVTGNPGKLSEAQRLFAGRLESADLDLPEIQSLDISEVLEAKGDDAWSRLGRPLVVEETGLELAGLNGFPGPLVKWMLAALGAEGMARVAMSVDEGAVARCRLLYVDRDRRLAAEGTCAGRVVVPARGEGGFGWDPVFQPHGAIRTYAEMTSEEKDAVSHRAGAWNDLTQKLVAAGVLAQR